MIWVLPSSNCQGLCPWTEPESQLRLDMCNLATAAGGTPQDVRMQVSKLAWVLLPELGKTCTAIEAELDRPLY